jgi:16S rRNA (adenine1518-N6/adenine1519-N6)-dimethyltransferase
MSVRAKKHLGQHFLNDENIARKIAESLSFKDCDEILEIGPGMGVLTKYLIDKGKDLSVVELDRESVAYLLEHYPLLKGKILHGDFLKFNLEEVFDGKQIAIIGNYPYNISSQILFKAIEFRHLVPEFGGMFQKEVAQRITQGPGSKTYGILSVITQAFYKAEYMFTVPPGVFTPPPKVESGVIRLVRKENYDLPVKAKFFFRVVKTAFNQRRKTLRNSLKSFGLSDNLREDAIFARRPEQLSVEEFIDLAKKLERDDHGNR